MRRTELGYPCQSLLDYGKWVYLPHSFSFTLNMQYSRVRISRITVTSCFLFVRIRMTWDKSNNTTHTRTHAHTHTHMRTHAHSVCVCVCVSKWKESARRNGKHDKRKSQARWKEKYRTGRGPFRQSSHCLPDKRKMCVHARARTHALTRTHSKEAVQRTGWTCTVVKGLDSTLSWTRNEWKVKCIEGYSPFQFFTWIWTH